MDGGQAGEVDINIAEWLNALGKGLWGWIAWVLLTPSS